MASWIASAVSRPASSAANAGAKSIPRRDAATSIGGSAKSLSSTAPIGSTAPRDAMLVSQRAAPQRNEKKNRSCQILVILGATARLPFTRGGTFMTILTRLHVIRLLALAMLLILPAASGAQQRPPILQKLTKTYGLESFGQIEAIRYTFNAEAPGLNFSRSWTWEPKTDEVTYEGKDKSNPVKVTYLRSQLGSQPANVRDDIDPGFVNDNYWLLLPFHFSWDTNAEVKDAGVQKLPQGNGTAEKVVVKYSSDGGYSPGDTWELYVGGDGRIAQMAYHRGGPAKLEVFATWTDYKKAGPLLFSLDHRGTRNGDPLHLFFSNVAVKLVGSNTWMDAR
jgi:hypothetical protein